MINIKEDEKLSVLNHSCAHLLAQAVKHLYKDAKFWVGPVIKEGFYYDIDLGDIKLNDDDLVKIEKEMKKISKDGKKIIRHELSKSEALDMFKDDPYKIDLINEMTSDTIISCYTQGDFTDLCRGPHVETVKEIKNHEVVLSNTTVPCDYVVIAAGYKSRNELAEELSKKYDVKVVGDASSPRRILDATAEAYNVVNEL